MTWRVCLKCAFAHAHLRKTFILPETWKKLNGIIFSSKNMIQSYAIKMCQFELFPLSRFFFFKNFKQRKILKTVKKRNFQNSQLCIFRWKYFYVKFLIENWNKFLEKWKFCASAPVRTLALFEMYQLLILELFGNNRTIEKSHFF